MTQPRYVLRLQGYSPLRYHSDTRNAGRFGRANGCELPISSRWGPSFRSQRRRRRRRRRRRKAQKAKRERNRSRPPQAQGQALKPSRVAAVGLASRGRLDGGVSSLAAAQAPRLPTVIVASRRRTELNWVCFASSLGAITRGFASPTRSCRCPSHRPRGSACPTSDAPDPNSRRDDRVPCGQPARSDWCEEHGCRPPRDRPHSGHPRRGHGFSPTSESLLVALPPANEPGERLLDPPGHGRRRAR